MAIAHVCLGCGFDLARQRVAIEPHYRFPLVTCPRCRHAAVRQRHSMIAAWRLCLRVHFALSMLVLQALIVMALSAATLFSSFGMVIVFWQFMSGSLDRDAGWFVIWPLGLVGPITGVWLTAGLAHQSRWRAWSGWFIWIVLWIVLISLELGVFHGLPPGARMVQSPDASMLQLLPGIFVVITAPALGAFAAVLLSAAVVGVPLGMAVKALFAAMQQHLWRLQLRRFRRGRAM